jgi:drug/metabolite transporter (DMT)-like permease
MSDNLRGAAWILVSCVAASSMMLAVRGASGTVHPLQIAFCRFLVGFFLVMPVMLSVGRESMATRRLPLHVLRGIIGILSIGMSFYALAMLPLVTAAVLFFTSPLFVTLLAIPMLGERVDWRRIIATLCGFLGTAVVLGFDPRGFHPAMLLALASAMLFAVSLILGKKLAVTEEPKTILFYFMVVTVLGSAAPAAFVWETPGGHEILLLGLVGAFATARAYCDIRGFAVGDASFVAPFSYIRIVLVGVAGYLLFAEVPTTNALVGAGIIVVSALYIAEREARRGRAGAQM